MVSARSERLKQRRRQESIRKTRKWNKVLGRIRGRMEERAAATKKAAENGRNMELYNITKTIAGERKRQEVGVKDKQGVLKTEAQERLQSWVEHFSETLNRDVPMNPVEEGGGEELKEIEEIDLGRWRVQEVKSAFKMTKRRKAAGVDEVRPDLLRADMEETASRQEEGAYHQDFEERWFAQLSQQQQHFIGIRNITNYDRWVNRLSHDWVTKMWIATFRPLYCWSSSGDGVNWLRDSISSTLVCVDWCVSILS